MNTRSATTKAGMPQPSAYRQEEMIRVARELLRAGGICRPPVDVELLAHLQGVHEIRLEPLNGPDAELSPVDNGYVIRADPRTISARRRFSIAHEVAHTFFGHNHKSYHGQAVTLPKGVARGLGYRLEEMLCDQAAAEMTMPRELFLEEARGHRPSVDLVTRLAQAFQTSIESTAIRYTTLVGPPAQVTMWRKRGTKLQGNWTRGPKVIDAEVISLHDPEGGVETMIARAFASNCPARDWRMDGYQRVLVDLGIFGPANNKYVLSILQSARFS